MGGKSNVVATTPSTIASLRLQSSVAGQAIPIMYGRCRVPANLIAYYDFAAIAHTTTTGGGGKGAAGGTVQKNTTFTYQAAVMMALGEGPVRAILRGWRGKNTYGAAVTVNAANDIATEVFTVPASTGTIIASLEAVFVAPISVVWVGVAPVVSDGHTINPGDTLVLNYNYTIQGPGNYNFPPDFRDIDSAIQINYLVSDATAQPSALPSLGLSLANGWDGQPPWGYLTSLHPDQALGYSGDAYLYAAGYDLGTDAEVGNHNFEVSTFTEFSPTVHDADPSVVVADFMRNGRYGVPNAPALGDLTAFSNYCVAQGLFISLVVDTQQSASDWLKAILDLVNVDVVWSEGLLKFVPLGDAAVAGNGRTYAPDTTPLYDLTIDDFLSEGEAPPIKVTRVSPTDVFNVKQLEIFDRADSYNTAIIQASDAADIDERGLRTDSVMQAHMICEQSVGRMAAQLILQMGLAIRATYEFNLPWTFGRLEPLDLVTLTEPDQGLFRWPVRINQVEENEDGSFTITAEDAPIGMASAPAYGTQANIGFAHDYNADPGSVTFPFFFEPPIELTTSGLEVWAAASGNTPLWGGCDVWASLDGVTYKQMAKIVGGSRYGPLTAALDATGGGTIAVALAGLGGAMPPASAADAANDQSLVFVGDLSGGEFIDYEGSTATGANAYALTPLLRGRYGSNVNARGSATVVRVDAGIGKSDPLALDLVGADILFKFCSFNVYGGGTQSLADVAPYGYTITGAMLMLPPSDVTGLTFSLEPFGIRLSWLSIPDQDLADYEVRIGGTSWETATFLARAGGTSYLWAVQEFGTHKIWVKARDLYGNDSLNAAELDVMVPLPNATNLVATIIGPNVSLTWTAVAGAYAIDHYIVRFGETFASAVALAAPLSTNFQTRVTFGGTGVFYVSAVDVAGNEGPAVSAQVDIAPPGPPIAGNAGHPAQEVIDNNVLLYWSPPLTGTLPIDSYQVRRGTSFAGGTVVGSNGNSTFAAIFEQVSGMFTYWIAAIDTAGNLGPAVPITATVNQPPDFVLHSSIDSTFGGTLVGLYLEAGNLFGPALGETIQTHFESRSWATIQDQIAAGYPLVFEPSGTAASYEELFDYGTVLAAVNVTATLASTILNGSVSVACQISYKALMSDPWTLAPAGSTSVFASNFQYVRVHYDFAATGGDDLIELTALNVRLAVKLMTDSGEGYANATDASGTPVSFNLAFINADTPQIQPSGTTAVIGIVDYVDAPYPTTFRVYLFNTAGVRVSGNYSWTTRGF